MPLRILPFRAAVHLQCLPLAAQQQRLFHGTRSLRDEIDDKNHYETLNVKTNASAADIKKSFYTLSKTHHPDHNPADPHASRRFMRISEAYTTLSHVPSRAKYDRDVLRLHESSSPHHHSQHAARRAGASYHSSGPAGGRPASGLSRRRGTFRGPPPSFFRSGGWGAHGAKRSAAHEESTGAGGAASSSAEGSEHAQRRSAEGHTGTGSWQGSTTGGMGPGQEPYGRGAASGEVPHFDRGAQTAHTRSQAQVDEARARRARTEGGFAFPGAGAGASDLSELGNFFAVAGVLGLAVTLPYLAISAWTSGGGRKEMKKIRDQGGR